MSKILRTPAGEWAENERQPLTTGPKPPLGLVPRALFEERLNEQVRAAKNARLVSIANAVQRYNAAGRPIPPEWLAERADLEEEDRVAVVLAAAANCLDCTKAEFCHTHALQRWPQYKPKLSPEEDARANLTAALDLPGFNPDLVNKARAAVTRYGTGKELRDRVTVYFNTHNGTK